MCKSSLPDSQGPSYSAAAVQALLLGHALDDQDPPAELATAHYVLTVVSAPQLTRDLDRLGAGPFVGALLNFEALVSVEELARIMKAAAPDFGPARSDLILLEQTARALASEFRAWIDWASEERPEFRELLP